MGLSGPAGLCLYRGIRLAIIHPADLSLEGMRRKLPAGLPLRDLSGHEPLMELLEERSIIYGAHTGTRP